MLRFADGFHKELRDVVYELLSDVSIRNLGIFDPHQVQRLINLDRVGRVDGAYTIFSLACIEMWCRMFLDGESPLALSEAVRKILCAAEVVRDLFVEDRASERYWVEALT